MAKYAALKERIVVSKNNSLSNYSQLSRPSNYSQWDSVSMSKAMQAVELGVSIRRASEMYGVPKSTLQDRLSGKVQHGCRPGAPSYLTHQEEEEVKAFLIKCAGIGYPHTISQVLAIVQQIIENKGIDRKVSHGWWQRFCQRHKDLSLRTAVPLSLSRAKATDSECLERYCDMLEDTLKKNNIFNNPMRIYNCDETGMPLNPKGVKVIAKTGSKDVSSVSGETKSQITVLACTCANGTYIPPFVLFDRKTLNPELTTGEIPGTLYGMSDTGWMNSEFFMYWFYNHFLNSIPSVRPILLLMDGHSSHYNPEVIRAAADEKIILFTLPPNTTHITQPLDKGAFSPLKTCWKRVCHEFYTKNPGRVVSRFDFSSLFSEAWKLSMTPHNIFAGFQATGVYPFDRCRIQVKVPEDKRPKFQPESLAERTGLVYIPLYSPLQRSGSELSDSRSDHSPLQRSLSMGNISNYSPVTPVIRLKKATSVSRFLNTPLAPSKIPTKSVKSCGKVLTSLENLQILEEKEKAKAEELKKKEERKALRAENARRRAEKAEEKRLAKAKLQKKGINMTDQDKFTEEEISLYNKRYENGYDLPDERYFRWLDLNHPSASDHCKYGFMCCMFIAVESATDPSGIASNGGRGKKGVLGMVCINLMCIYPYMHAGSVTGIVAPSGDRGKKGVLGMVCINVYLSLHACRVCDCSSQWWSRKERCVGCGVH